jgi:hypothetical protein
MGILAQPFLAMSAPDGLVANSAATERQAKGGEETKVEDCNPFTHVADIPVSSDPATIKFEKVKATKVFTKVKFTRNEKDCRELQFRDPGGSMYCPYTQDESPEAAYEVTYSYTGEPLASDEYGNRNFRLQVYFRPEELPPTLRRAIAAGKVKRAELASYFDVTTSHLPVREAVIDQANSRFCDGNYMDGNWIRHDPNCQDQVSVKTVTGPSEYITVRVEPTLTRSARSYPPER